MQHHQMKCAYCTSAKCAHITNVCTVFPLKSPTQHTTYIYYHNLNPLSLRAYQKWNNLLEFS